MGGEVMNEDQIERWYERQMNALDADLMNGFLSEGDYNKNVKELTEELNAMYHELRNPYRD
jgi:hypothetical protein